MLRVGILGCGSIAAKVADSLKDSKKVAVTGVASRERNKAKKFAAAHCPDAKVPESRDTAFPGAGARR